MALDPVLRAERQEAARGKGGEHSRRWEQHQLRRRKRKTCEELKDQSEETDSWGEAGRQAAHTGLALEAKLMINGFIPRVLESN